MMQYKEIKEGFEAYEFRQGEPVGEPISEFDLPADANNEVPF